jgi:hypothetical protein
MSENDNEADINANRRGIYFDDDGLKLWDSIKVGDKSKTFSRMAILGNHLRANEVSKRTLLAGLASGFFQQLGIITNPNSSFEAIGAAKKALFAGIDNSWGNPVLGEVIVSNTLVKEEVEKKSIPEEEKPKRMKRPGMSSGGMDLKVDL